MKHYKNNKELIHVLHPDSPPIFRVCVLWTMYICACVYLGTLVYACPETDISVFLYLFPLYVFEIMT